MSRRTAMIRWGPVAVVVLIMMVGPAADGVTFAGSTPREPESPVRQVERMAMDAARNQVPKPDRFKVLSVRSGGVDPLPRGETRFEVADVTGPNAAGLVVVTFRMLGGEVPRGELRVTVRGKVFGPVVVATRALVRGVPVDATGVTVSDVDLTRLRELPLRDPEQALGLVPIRTLGRDRVLTVGLLGPEPIVRRGEPVDLRILSGRVTVRATGTARRNGAPGDIVPAENTATGAEVLGRVQPDGSLLVIRGATRGRS